MTRLRPKPHGRGARFHGTAPGLLGTEPLLLGAKVEREQLQPGHPQRPESRRAKCDEQESGENQQVDEHDARLDRLKAGAQRAQQQEARRRAKDAYRRDETLVPASAPERESRDEDQDQKEEFRCHGSR